MHLTNVSKFVILPCLDSEQMAASRRRELDLSKYAAASQEALRDIEH